MGELSGALRVEERHSGRVWVAKFDVAGGGQTRRVLGKAWVKRTARTTLRGAPIWRAADGSVPEGHLSPKDAEARLAELLAEQQRIADATAGAPARRRAGRRDITFGDATADWLAYLEVEKGVAATTLNRYRSLLRAHLFDALGEETLLRRITAARINALLDEVAYGRRLSKRGTPLSADSRRQMYIVLSGIFKRAERRGWVAASPMGSVDRPRQAKPSGEFHVLTPVQVEAVARAAAVDWSPVQPGARNRTTFTEAYANRLTLQRRWAAMHWAACIRIAAYTGLRMGELRALRWEHIDWSAQVIHVRRNAPASLPSTAFATDGGKLPKSGKVGSVPMVPQAAATLEALTRRTLDPDDRGGRPMYIGPRDYVFPAFDGELADIEPTRAAFYRALTAIGLGHLREQKPPIRFHDLRHTFGTLAVRKFPLSDVQRWMRHADITTTMRYVHYVPQHDAAQRLGEVFAAELGPFAVDPADGARTAA